MGDGEPYHRLALPANTRLREYEIEKTLGAGGFGVTYLARHKYLGAVAIKEYMPNEHAVREGTEVFPKSSGDEDLYRRGLAGFLREARALREFRDERIVGVRDFFEQNGTAYMVLDYEEGETLEQLLAARGGKLPEKELLAIVFPLLNALEKLHAAGLVHRDISPDNIIIRPGRGPVLIDFGAARHAIGDVSKSISIIHKSGYSPPEQRLGGKQGKFTDIYALSATLYRAMTGNAPPEGSQRIYDITAGGEDSMPPLSADGYSERFVRAVTAGLAIKPKERPQTIREWRDMLYPLPADKPKTRQSAPPSAKKASPKGKGGAWKWAAALLLIVAFFYQNDTESEKEAAAYQAAEQADSFAEWMAFLDGDYGSGEYRNKAANASIKNGKGVGGKTLLHIASGEGNFPAVTLLIAGGADVDARRPLNNYTPLHNAADGGYAQIIGALALAGGNPNLKSKRNHTPLHLAAYRGHIEAAEALIKAGADVDAVNDENAAPLHLAATKSSPKNAENGNIIIDMLLGAGANIDACWHTKNNGRLTALGSAIFNNHRKAEEILRKAGATIEEC